MEKQLKKTPLNGWHKEHGAHMIAFAGWQMPIAYREGILHEHLSTRKYGGLFDISHMGRFFIRGKQAIPFLQHVLTNNALALDPGMAQYTLIPNETGGALDDAYLYCLDQNDDSQKDLYLLVVNASNRQRDLDWLTEQKQSFDVTIEDKTEELGMMALQGPHSKEVLEDVITGGPLKLPDPWRNRLKTCEVNGTWITSSRTGYTGEPLCFEIFVPAEKTKLIWEKILDAGQRRQIVPAGLGARDTLRLEAGLPLYGHELGLDWEGKEIPIFGVPNAAHIAVSFSELKGDFIGRHLIWKQFQEYKARKDGLPLPPKEQQVVPRLVLPLLVKSQGIARQGHEVFSKGERVGAVTSGTAVPYWDFSDKGILSKPLEEKKMRSIALAYIDADLEKGDTVEIRHRGKTLDATVVERNLTAEAPPYARPVFPRKEEIPKGARSDLNPLAAQLAEQVAGNTLWRQKATINLIPSETTPSLLTRFLTMMDPSGRYAEHKEMEAFGYKEVFYYQGTKLIEQIEAQVIGELCDFFQCSKVEPRIISGQMANAALFSGLLDYVNRVYRKSTPRRIRKVINHHLTRGGHLSAQPMGALRDYVAVDQTAERWAAFEFPVLEEDPYQIDLAKTKELIELHQPELIVLGKSMMLYREPVKEIADMISGMSPKPILHYDMAHVLGLHGPDYQEPLKEGADLVTGSTHKTFFGPQRGVIVSNMSEGTEYEDLWETIVRRVFPGSVSNHHLGTLLGLLMAAYEMNAFKKDYQKAVLANAKAFALALKNEGLNVEGNPQVGYTETHQVVVRVGFGRGPFIAEQLEENNIIVNYQGAPDDEGFTAASCLRMGVQEMTRFGMKEDDFGELADLMSQVILYGKDVATKVSEFRKKFTDMKYCLPVEEAAPLVKRLWEALW